MIQPRCALHLDAVQHNVARWRRYVGEREVWAVVKSEAYGCGSVAVARASLAGGAARLVVFDVGEAQPLRAAGIQTPIVQVFPARGDDLVTAARLSVAPTVEDESGAREVSALAQWRGRRIAVHLAIDTGTGWSGIAASRASEFARAVRGLPGIVWEGAWTHVAGKDSMDAQLRSFATAVATLRAEGIAVPVIHSASTGPALWGKTTGAVRIGIGLHGSSLGESAAALGLRTALEVRAGVIAVKTFDADTPLGYGGEDAAHAGETIATLRIGYVDGLPKSLAGGGAAFVGEMRCPIAGAIGMNCTMIRVPAGTAVSVGDEALIVGDHDGARLDDVAGAAGIIPHALLTGIARAMGVARVGGAP